MEIKRSRREQSYKWCARHGLAEQRLYEMAKLQKQFDDILHNSMKLGGRQGGGAEGDDDSDPDGDGSSHLRDHNRQSDGARGRHPGDRGYGRLYCWGRSARVVRSTWRQRM